MNLYNRLKVKLETAQYVVGVLKRIIKRESTADEELQKAKEWLRSEEAETRRFNQRLRLIDLLRRARQQGTDVRNWRKQPRGEA